MKPLVGVIGLPAVDQVAHLPDFPDRGGHVSGTALTIMPGGPACNYVAGIARLGGRSILAGSVGTDIFGKLLKEGLQAEGVQILNANQSEDYNTVTVLALFDEDGRGEQRSFSFGLLESMNHEPITNPQGLEQVDALFLDGILAFSDLWVESAVKACQKLKSTQKRLVFCDPNLRVPGSTLPQDLADRLDLLFQVSNILLINEHESLLITGEADAEKSAVILLEKYPAVQTVVVKLGAKGALIQTRNGSTLAKPVQIKPFEVQVVDTSGAGDSFGASFILALLEGKSLVEAGELAAAAGAFATTAKGAWLGLPTLEQRDEMLKSRGESK